MSELKNKKCVPCEGGAIPFDISEIHKYQKKVDGWNIIKNKKDNLPTNTSFYNAPNLPKNHNHVEFFFKDIRLIYNDPRRFGYFQVFNDFNSVKKKFIKFGPEPFDKKFNSKYLINYFKKMF